MIDILDKMTQNGDILKETFETYKSVIQEPVEVAAAKDESLENIKKQIVGLFPQLKKYDFVLRPGDKEGEYLWQGKEGEELYGHIYKVNIENKTLELED
jgi:hypothetical protein